MILRFASIAVAVTALLLIVLSLWRLEAARDAVEMSRLTVGETPVTVYTSEQSASLVIVSHGFAGSRQMMEAISLTLARAGHTVAAFDYLGHGRHPEPLSPDIDSLTGTTEDLVLQTLAVTQAMQARFGPDRTALVGHSMATDVAVRAAERLGITDVVAISMYSEAVTPAHPERLLIVSGAQEGRLRDVALDVVAQIGAAEEGVTVNDGAVERRAVVAPLVGHAGVLWSPTTSSEIAAWLGSPATPTRTGLWIGTLLAAITALFWPLSRLLPQAPPPARPSLRRAMAGACVAAAAGLLAALSGLSALGLAGFGALALFLAAHGVAALAILRPRFSLTTKAIAPAVLLLVWGLGAFALALDRYGAAFLPAGPRLPLMALLIPAAMLFAIGDRAIVHGRHVLLRVLLRLPVLAALLGAMLLQPQMGMLFTVLPVFVLYLAVFGSMAHWAAHRSGATGPALASGVILAWSIAASTPLFLAP